MKEQKIIQLSERDHILLRPSLWVGSVSKTKSEEIILEDNKFKKKEIAYVPGLIKIINEIIDNSVDEAVRTDYQYADRIKVEVDEKSVSVYDNGRGIPVKKDTASGEYMPVLAFCNARAGSNFENDEERITAGLNGVGSTLTNIYSNLFNMETSDGSNRLSLICKNNLEERKVSVRKNSRKLTHIYFEPDLSRFDLKKIDQDHIEILKQRILFLSVAHPKIKFYLNKKRISFSNEKDFMSYFSESFEILKGENWFIGVYPNTEDEFSHFSYINGLFMKKGGAHIDLIANTIGYRSKEILKKKYKEIKPADIKNKISIVVFFNGFKNMKFDSQTKETLTNSPSDIKNYLDLSTDDWEKFVRKLLSNKEINENIVEFFKMKEEIKKRKKLKDLSNNKKKRVQSDSYFPPIGKKKYLFITEGASATGGVSKVLGRKEIAYYSLRGKPLNVLDCKISRIVKNKEIKDLIEILDLDLTNPNTTMSFDKVIFLSDQDSDGIHIRSLLLTFFHKFAPRIFKEGKVCFMNTPLIIAYKNNKVSKWFLTFKEYNEWKKDKKGYDFRYYKGLGSFNKEDLNAVIKKSGSMEDFFVSFNFNEDSKKSIEKWFSGKKAEERKEELRDRKFNLFLV